MAYPEDRVNEAALRFAMWVVAKHAKAPIGSSDRLPKEELMKYIDVIDKAQEDQDWTVYYP